MSTQLRLIRTRPLTWLCRELMRSFDLRAIHHSEEGTMAQVTVIVIMGFAMLLGLVGNIGRMVQKKVAVQNAADSVAYSTALWQARSMNAVTAVNHLLGEVSSICILHEAIGGPELDHGRPQNSDEFNDLNDKIKTYRPISLVAIHMPGLYTIDERIIDMVRRVVTFNEGDDGRTTAGATLYDARITIKQLVAFFQDVKVAGNVLIDLGKIPVLAFLIPIGAGMHAVSTPILIKCGTEAGMLLVLEGGARLFIIPKRLLERQMMPLLASYSDDLMKAGGVGNPRTTSVQNTLKELESRHSVKANVFPAPSQITLPLVAEAAPKSGGSSLPRSQSVSAGWPGDIDKIVGMIKDVTDVVDFFNDATDLIPGVPEITGWFEPNFPPTDNDGAPQNFSRDAVKNLNADWQNEESSQWVRATYPWVDSLRAPIIKGMKSPLVLQLSKAGVWYGHWTNRFTLAKSFCYRSGRSMSKSGGSQKKMKMYVMREMRPDRKGREPWTTDSPQAEQLFTVMGFTTHHVDALFSPAIYSSAGHDQAVYAQAMFYNANPQQPGNSGPTQPRVGWDTLNWNPPVSVPEYGTVPTERGSMWPPWAIFEKKSQSNTPAIKLNWQAKLVPVTRRRLSQAAAGTSYQGNIRESIIKALVNSKQLDTH